MKAKLLFLSFILFSSSAAISQSIQSFSPSTGNAGEMINVTITGQNTNFQQGTDVIKLTNGSTVISPQQSTFVNDSLIQSLFAFNKDHPTGYYNLSIQKYGSYTLNLNNCFYLNPDPTIALSDSVYPSSASQGDTITLTINGLNTNFGSTGVPTTIWLKQGTQQINGSNIIVVDSTTIHAQFIFTYGYPVGSYDVYFYNLLDGTVTDAGGFILNAGPATPSIVSCLPNSGTQGQLLTVSITGQNTNFQQGTDVIKLTNGSTIIIPQQSTFVNDTLIHSTFAFTTSDPTGYYSLSIQNVSYTLYLNNCFYLYPSTTTPSIVSVTPTSANQCTTATLTITGLNTHFGHTGTTTTPSLKYGTYQIYPSSTTIVDSITIQTQFVLSTAYPTGIYNVCITNTIDGSLVLNNGFTINTGPTSPIITSVSPNIGSPGQTLTVSITGQNTNFQQGTDNVNLFQGYTYVYPSNLTFNSGTLINATFSFSTSQPTGYYNVNIIGHNPIILTNGFLVAQPCSAQYTIVPDTTIPHHYYVINNASGYQPINYLWSWGDGTYDSIAYPSHTYNTAGTYTICLSITDSIGCTSTYCDSSYLQKNPNTVISVDVIPPTVTGINIYELYGQIKVYPNPTTNNITIESPQQAVIEILNIQGQLIKTITANSNKTNVDVSAFPCGVYVVEVKTEQGVAIKKFVKQ
ncbi:MAG: T9SS type A sorting domain-containing protein [Bacteroidales bacterium]